MDGSKVAGRAMTRAMMIFAGAFALGGCGGLDWGGTADDGGGGSTGGECMEGNNGCDCKSDGTCNGDLTCHPDEGKCFAGLEGHWVRCCYQGTWSPHPDSDQQHCGCQDTVKMCIKPDVWDVNGNGQLEGSELREFCNARCSAWDVTYGLKPKWNFYECGTENPILGFPPNEGQDFLSCEAIDPDLPGGLPAAKIVERYACDPPYKPTNEYPNYLETWGIDVDPLYETDFSSSSSGNEVEIWISGTELVPSSYDLNAQYYLDGCEDLGNDHWRCDFVLTGLALAMPSMSFGDFLLQDVELVLNERVAADVFFFPGRLSGYYTGFFELSESEGNAVGTNLSWTQINRVKETSIDNMLHLGNTDGSLGGLDEIHGIFYLTPSSMELRLIGYGTDSISGGDWASVDFDLIDDVVPISR